MTKKILPQCQYIQYWHDNADRLTFMQDANLRSKNKYRFMLYDCLGRLCLHGLCDDFDRSVNVSDVNPSGGRKQNGHVGKIDNLHIYHKGNQLDWVKDDADKIYYAGIFNFNGDDNNEAHYKYNDCGSLTEDTGRGITNIEYDDWNNPRRIQFSNGNVTKYVYSADGEKLRTIHYTATPNITVAQSQIHELSKGEILSVDSTDYIGGLIMKNDTPDMYLFAGGYYKFISNADLSSPTGGKGGSCYFYNYDHLGNVREVVNEEGKLEQVNNYYPFGAPFSDNSITAKNPGFQPYKYTGKELDLVHGLNTYDHGARQNYSIIGVWDRIDPLAEKYYGISPYVYCHNNPIIKIDPNGLTDYELYKNGLIKHRKFDDSKTDRLFVHSSHSYIAISRGILNQLLNQRDGFKGHFAFIKNRNDAFKLFKFVSDNSDVEWSLKGFKEGNSFTYKLTTSNLGESVDDNNSDKSILGLSFDLHSHPRINGRDEASGNYIDTKGLHTFNSVYFSGDLKSVISVLGTIQRYRKINNMPKFYIYNAKTETVFRYDWQNSHINKQRIINYYQLGR